MARILVHGLKAKVGGGKSTLNNFLSLLREKGSPHEFFLLVPEEREYERYERPGIQIVHVPKILSCNPVFPCLYYYAIPQILRSREIDLIFNLGGIVIPTRCPQVCLLYTSDAADE